VKAMSKKLVQAPNRERLEALQKCELCKAFNYCWSFPNGNCFKPKKE